MTIMPVLEIPALSVEPALVDPHYEDRYALVETGRAPSYPAIPIGSLANMAAFSAPLGLPNSDRIEIGWSRPRLGIRENQPIEIHREFGRLTYAFDDDLAQFSEAIEKIAAHEHAAYPDINHTAVYLTVRQSAVRARVSQLFTDDFHRDTSLFEWSHIYAVSDTQPTRFFATDEAIFGRDQLPEGVAPNPDQVMIPEPYEIVFANGTTFHSSPEMEKDSFRTFLRLMYIHGSKPPAGR